MLLQTTTFLLLILKVFAVNENYCTEHGYSPENGYRNPPVTEQPYFTGSKIHYHCNSGYALNSTTSYQTCVEGLQGFYWEPSALPGCRKLAECGNLSVENGQTFVGSYYEGHLIDIDQVICLHGYVPNFSVNETKCTKNGTWSRQLSCKSSGATTVSPIMYCPRPQAIENGIILCCEGMAHLNACCPYEGKVQFECESGYELYNGLPEMKCSANGQWVPIEPHAPNQYPVCVPVESTTAAVTRPNAFKLSDDMIRTVIGVAAGVLSLLLIVIILAFCKPKLKDIKRRWRDKREDENGLIVNGQRVNLPSYEEATSCAEQLWFDSYNRVGSIPPPLNSLAPSIQRDSEMTRPPESNLDGDVIMPVGDRVLVDEAPGTSAFAFEDSFLSFFDPSPSVPSNAADSARTGAESPDSACALLTSPEPHSNVGEVRLEADVRRSSFDNVDYENSVTQQTNREQGTSRDSGGEVDSGSVIDRFLVSGGQPSTAVVLTSPDYLHTDSTSV